jgi:aspartate/methionine/tyrosine aminotransferase
MVAEAGIATVPGSSFYRTSEDGANLGSSLIRFCYCSARTLALAERLLSRTARAAHPRRKRT